MILGGDIGLWGGVVRRCCGKVILGCGEVLLGGVVGRCC